MIVQHCNSHIKRYFPVLFFDCLSILSCCFPVFILQVSLTVGLGGESKVADFAFKGLLAGMPPHVAGQSALVIADVGTRANITLVWCFAQVLLVVPLQGPQVWKHSGALAARKLSLHFHLFDYRIII